MRSSPASIGILSLPKRMPKPKPSSCAPWKAFYASFIHLWKTLGGQPKNAIVPENGADLLTSGIAIAGASKTVTQAIEHQRSIGKMTFLSANLAFGDMSDEVCRHSIESFAAQVMPVFSKEARVFQPS